MGKRVHVIKKHEEYGSSAEFNWQYEEFNDFLGHLGCYMCHKEYDYDRFECGVDEYETALSLVEAYKEYGRCEKVEEMFNEADADIDMFETSLKKLGGLDHVLTSMQNFYNERDKESGWIGFCAW